METKERLQKDYEGIVEVFDKEYSRNKQAIELNSAKILQEHIISVILRSKKLKGNMWFKFKIRNKLRDMYLKIERADKWEFY